MSNITTVIGAKENIAEDIHAFSGKLVDNPQVLIVAKKDIKTIVVEKASTLFIDSNLVLVLLDPEKELLDEINAQLLDLKERIHIVLYMTSPPTYTHSAIGGETVVFEKERGKRIRDRVLTMLKRYDKVMTDKGFKLFSERIKDESALETELMKLINYIGGRKEIKSGDVMSIVTETHEESLLSFFEVIAQKDKKERLNIFENLLINGLNILAIQGFLVKQTRLMLHAKDMEEIFKANPEYSVFSKTFNKWKESVEPIPLEKKLYLPFQKTYYAYKLSKTSQKFKRKDLLFFLDMLLHLDTEIKSGTKHERIYLESGLMDA